MINNDFPFVVFDNNNLLKKLLAMWGQFDMKTFVFLITISFFSTFSSGQENLSEIKENRISKKYSVFIAHDFFFTISPNIEILFQGNEKTSWGFRIGLGYDGGEKSLTAIGQGIFLYGKSKHFLEMGIGYQQPYYYFDEGPDPPTIALMIGYRYQSKKGFLFKIYPEFIPAIFPDEDSWGHLPFIGFALGYSF